MRRGLVYVIGQLGAGGQERQLCWLLRGLVARGIRPAVVVWNLSESDEFLPIVRSLGIPVEGLTGALSGRQKLLRFRSIVKLWGTGLIHSYSFYTNFAAHFAAGRTATAIGSIRSDFAHDRLKAGAVLGRLSACRPRIVICNSRSAQDNIRHFPGIFKPARVHVVRNGLDLAAHPAHPLPVGEAHVVGLGRLVAVKRWDLLLEAAAILRDRQLPVRVTIAGDGPLRSTLQADAERRGLQDLVTFPGYDGDVSRLFLRSSLLALTSDTEGCPNVVMEAMACGRAVVATDVGDARYLIDEGHTGFLTPRGDAATLAERIARLITDGALCGKMGGAGRSRAEQDFGLDRMVDETLAVYRSSGWRG